MATLSDLYDADRRTTDPEVWALAAQTLIPHPLSGLTYADGTAPRRPLAWTPWWYRR